MSNDNKDRIITIVLGILMIGVLIKLFKGLMDKTKTEIISDEGFNALNNPAQKIRIDKAFAEAAEEQRQTGIWKNPELDLSQSA